MCEFHDSSGNGFGHIWWTDNPIYFSSIDRAYSVQGRSANTEVGTCCLLERGRATLVNEQ